MPSTVTPTTLTAVLVAGTPRRVADCAGGAHERLLDIALMTAIDRRIGGVPSTELDRLARTAQAYRTATTGLLLAMLWHPWRTRLRLRHRIRALRADVKSPHRQHRAAIAVLTQEEHAGLLYQRLDPDGQRWEAWGLEQQPPASR